jgi:urease accessory protein
MSVLPPARTLIRAGHGRKVSGHVVLTYTERLLRRKRLTTTCDQSVLLDLPETVSVHHGDAFECVDGQLIEVVAADEDVLEISGDLPRFAWHIGNRHTPCQIEKNRLLILQDHVLEAMLLQLGAHIHHITEPFKPEGGAYGMGRTMGHSHAPDTHDHGHDRKHADEHD